MTCRQARKLLDNPRVRQQLDRPDAGTSGQCDPHAFRQLREHLGGCPTCARHLAENRAIGALLTHRIPHVRDSDLAPAVLKAIRDRSASSRSSSLKTRWRMLPLEWRAVPIAGAVCVGLTVGWLESRDSTEDNWITGLDAVPAEQIIITALIPAEPWGGEGP